MRARLALPVDVPAIARIYNEGIAERVGTFETRLRSEDDVRAWFDGVHPVVVVEDEGGVVAFASSSPYRARECYAGIAEFAVYVSRSARRRGAGRLALEELVARARATGFWKLVSRAFVENAPSRALCSAVGFREVGTYYRHAKLDGEWRDVVIVEKFLAPVSPPGDGRAGPPLSQAAQEERIEAALDEFVGGGPHDSARRERFVKELQAYASGSPDAARALWERVFARLGRSAIGADLSGLYETLFVVKQAIGLSGGRLHLRDLAPQVPQLVAWLKEVIALPPDTRGRISPANLSSLLMSLAVTATELPEQKQSILQLVPEAIARHRVDPPPSIRPPPPEEPRSRAPPPLPLPRPPPLPGAKTAEPSKPRKRTVKKKQPKRSRA